MHVDGGYLNATSLYRKSNSKSLRG